MDEEKVSEREIIRRCKYIPRGTGTKGGASRKTLFLPHGSFYCLAYVGSMGLLLTAVPRAVCS